MDQKDVAVTAADLLAGAAVVLALALYERFKNRPKETNQTVDMFNIFHAGQGKEWLKKRTLEMTDAAIKDLMNGLSPMDIWPTKEEMETMLFSPATGAKSKS